MYCRYESKKNDVLLYGNKVFTVRHYSIHHEKTGVNMYVKRKIDTFSFLDEAFETFCDIVNECIKQENTL